MFLLPITNKHAVNTVKISIAPNIHNEKFSCPRKYLHKQFFGDLFENENLVTLKKGDLQDICTVILYYIAA